MRKGILSVFIALSLFLAPVAHSAGMDDSNCQTFETGKKDQAEKKQDNHKESKSTHHCGCAHTSAAASTVHTAQVTPAFTISTFTLEDESATSLVLGPPLKPPSHA